MYQMVHMVWKCQAYVCLTDQKHLDHLFQNRKNYISGGPGPCSDKFGSFSICEIPGKSVISSSALSVG